MRRWLFWIFVLFIVLLLGSALAAQIVLRTDLPRRIAIDVLQEQTGLRFHADSLETTWRGHTELRGLTISLPLEPLSSPPMLEVPSLQLSHTDLIRLMLFRDIQIDLAEIDQPTVRLAQDASGRWNIVQAAVIVEQTQAALHSTVGGVSLPRVSLRDAMIEVTAHEGDTVIYGPVSVEGAPDSPIAATAWSFALELAQETVVNGRVAPAGAWSHQVDFNFEAVRPLIDPWLSQLPVVPDLPADMRIKGAWYGEVRDGRLAGRLNLDRIVADDMTAEGRTAITVTADGLRIEPTNLLFHTGEPSIDPVRLLGGAIHASPDSVRLERVMIEAAGAAAQVDGRWDADLERGEAIVRWRGDASSWLPETKHEGVVIASFETPGIGPQHMSAEVMFRGSSPYGEWESAFDVAASGESWTSLTGSLSTRALALYGEEHAIDLSGLSARLRRDGAVVRLTHVNLPDGSARGEGFVNLDSGAWSLDMALRQWAPSSWLVKGYEWIEPVDVRVQAIGDSQRIVVDRFAVTQAETRLTAAGVYVFGASEPLDARLTVRTTLPANGAEMTGAAEADVAVRGGAQPWAFHMDGQARVRDLSWSGRSIEDVQVVLTGSINEHAAQVNTEFFSLLGGRWRMNGSIDLDRLDVRATLEGVGTAIERLIATLDLPIEMTGKADASIDVFVPRFDLSLTEVHGAWAASNVLSEPLFESPASVVGAIRSFGEHVHLHEMHVEYDGGTATGDVRFSLSEPERIRTVVNLNQWPHAFENARGRVDAAIDVMVDLNQLHAEGTLEGEGVVVFTDATDDLTEHEGAFSFEGTISERTLDLAQFSLEALGGSLTGGGRFVLSGESWTNSAAHVHWTNFDVPTLAQLSPRLALVQHIEGRSSGVATLRRETTPRAPEPMRVEVSARVEGGRFVPGEPEGDEPVRAIDFDTLELVGHLGAERLMIERAQLGVADGTITAWGRLSKHALPDGDALFSHIYLTLDRLDLDQIVAASGYADEPTPGRISGRLSVGGYVKAPHRMFGEGVIEVAESDLASVPGFALIHDILAPKRRNGGNGLTGSGQMTVRMENDAMEFSRITYFNRGTDVVGRLRIENIWLGRESPVSGLFGGVLRPLRDVNLPLIGKLDNVMSAIQTNAASVRVSGTLGDPQQSIAPLAEVTGALERVLRGLSQ